MCQLLTIPLDAARRAQLGSLKLQGLDALQAALVRDRAWPTEWTFGCGAPIASVTVLNPEIHGADLSDRGVVLDILAARELDQRPTGARMPTSRRPTVPVPPPGAHWNGTRPSCHAACNETRRWACNATRVRLDAASEPLAGRRASWVRGVNPGEVLLLGEALLLLLDAAPHLRRPD